MNQIRARFDAKTITVYQAYRPAIAEAAVAAQRFVAPFSFNRMTWVKPSFFWMMERCGWATKKDQECVLAIRMRREAFDFVVQNAITTDVTVEAAGLRVQWDPERDLFGKKLGVRAIQLGIGREFIERYASEWVVGIEDITPLVKKIDRLRRSDVETARRLVPTERAYA